MLEVRVRKCIDLTGTKHEHILLAVLGAQCSHCINVLPFVAQTTEADPTSPAQTTEGDPTSPAQTTEGDPTSPAQTTEADPTSPAQTTEADPTGSPI